MKKTAMFICAITVLVTMVVCCNALQNRLNKGPNVILIVIDTLRADKVGALGSTLGLTPHIDNLAKDSVIFTNCYAPSSWTVPSMASIFTGMYPSHHGVERGLLEKGKKVSQQILNEQYSTLTENLKNSGYTTFGYATNAHLMPEFGFGQGFDTYEVQSWAIAQWVTNKVANAKKRIRKSNPFFLYLHYFDPHEPYVYRPVQKIEFPEGFTPEMIKEISFRKLHGIAEDAEFAPGSPKLKVVEKLYEGEIMYTDFQLGFIFRQLGITDEDLVIITSDHGEAFKEHNSIGHGFTLYNEEIKVPLIIKFPDKKFAGQFVDEKVSLVDLMPTICTLAKANTQGAVDGVDLVDCLNTRVFPQRELYSDLDRPSTRIFSSIFRDWKFISDKREKMDYLFNLRSDKGELINVKDDNPKVAKRMTGQINTHLLKKPPYEAPFKKVEHFTNKELEKFREMGYL